MIILILYNTSSKLKKNSLMRCERTKHLCCASRVFP